MESLKNTTEEITVQCLYLPNKATSFARYLNEKVPDRFRALVLTAEMKLKQWAAQEAAEFQHFSTEAVLR